MDLFREINVQFSTLAVIVLFCITLSVVCGRLFREMQTMANQIQVLANLMQAMENHMQAMENRIDNRLTRLEDDVRNLQATIRRKIDEYEQYKDSGCDDEL